MADIRELYSGRVEAASIALARGDRSEAERLFAEAVVMGEENFGANDLALAGPLNELSRLYVRRSEYARAEPLLQHLLAIRCAKGENHPDVATVLAALAAVRRGLGDDAAAESLSRQALEIREMVHAPDHMAVVVTLEQLADTCAALRKFAEATVLYERARAVREKTLGPEHPTVRGLRERLTELAAKAAAVTPEVPRPVPAPLMTVAPEEARVSKELVFLYEPEKPVRRASVKRDRAVTPQFSAAVAAASLITGPAHASAPAPLPARTEVASPSLVIADPHEFDAAIMPRIEERAAPAPAPRRSQRIDAPDRAEFVAPRPKKKSTRYGYAAGGVAVLASAGFLSARLPSRPTSEPTSLASASQPLASVTPAAPTASRAALVAAPAVLAVVRRDSASSPKAKPQLAGPARKSPSGGAQVNEPSVNTDMPLLPNIGSLAMPETSAPNADSVMRVTTTRRDVDTEQIGTAGRLRTPTLGEDHSETVPVLVGVVPQPRFPDALRAQQVEGTVVVQFLVGVDGTVDPSSMKVVRSPHDLFTAAVRNVLPKLRFQPARTADAKPRAEWVQYSIQFSATK